MLKGSPALVIIDQVRETAQNLMAICTHGRSGVGRFMIGSVADSIIRWAGVQALVFAAPGQE